MKTCFKCLEEKPLGDFYKHSQMRDGYLNKCKVCTRRDSYIRLHTQSNRDKIREQKKKWSKTENARRIRRDYMRMYKKNAVARLKANAREIGRKQPKKPCVICGFEIVQAHHEDYSKPKDVIWYCAPHHRQRHADKSGLFKEIII